MEGMPQFSKILTITRISTIWERGFNAVLGRNIRPQCSSSGCAKHDLSFCVTDLQLQYFTDVSAVKCCHQHVWARCVRLTSNFWSRPVIGWTLDANMIWDSSHLAVQKVTSHGETFLLFLIIHHFKSLCCDMKQAPLITMMTYFCFWGQITRSWWHLGFAS